MKQPKFGTREWAEHNKNIYIGCPNGCKYCYARDNAVRRYGYVDSNETFINNPRFNEKNFSKKPKKYTDGRIMFPTTHDILPENIDKTIEYLEKWLEVGNHILIVSKPHFECINRICDEFEQYKGQIVFRFTIGSLDDHVLKFWEPNAPLIKERLKSLKHAYNKGFSTSISMEPKLDRFVRHAVEVFYPYVSDTIWIGNMNFMETRVNPPFEEWRKKDLKYKEEVEFTQTKEFIEDLYNNLKDNPKVRWKESIKKVLGLPDEESVA